MVGCHSVIVMRKASQRLSGTPVSSHSLDAVALEVFNSLDKRRKDNNSAWNWIWLRSIAPHPPVYPQPGIEKRRRPKWWDQARVTTRIFGWSNNQLNGTPSERHLLVPSPCFLEDHLTPFGSVEITTTNRSGWTFLGVLGWQVRIQRPSATGRSRSGQVPSRFETRGVEISIRRRRNHLMDYVSISSHFLRYDVSDSVGLTSMRRPSDPRRKFFKYACKLAN